MEPLGVRCVIYRFAGIAIDEDRDEIRCDGEVVRAQKKVRDLLLYLLHRRDRLVPKEELFAALWPGVVVNEAALTQAVYAARRAVGDDARRPRVLKTVRGRGVRFVAEVEELEYESEREAAGESVVGGNGGAPPFVGRDELLEELSGGLRAAESGQGGVFLLAGEAGIGKTRAAEEFAKRARAHGASVHFGRCHEAPGAPAFWPWVQLLRSQAEASGPERFAALLGTGAEDVAQIAPELVPGASDRAKEGRRRDAIGAPGPARFRLFDAVTRLLQQAALERPLMLVLEDLHRADPPSWRLLHFLTRELRGARILLVGTYRDADAHRRVETAEFLAELARQAGVRFVPLAGLGREAVGVILTAATGREADPVVLDPLYARTNGNPYFVVHLAGLLGRRIQTEPNVAPEDIALPQTLREAVAHQLQGLPAVCGEVLRTASVIGRSFSLPVLVRSTAKSRTRLLETLDVCVKAGLVVADEHRIGHFWFTHILVRDALYESLSIANRASLHFGIGEALAWVHADDIDLHIDKLAHHFQEASLSGDASRALWFTRRAGALARTRLAFEHAVTHYKAALQLLDQRGVADKSLRCELLLELGEAQTRAGRREEARTNFSKAASLASRLGADETLAKVALASAPGFFSIESGVYDSFTVSLLESALDVLNPKAYALRAQTLARLAMALYWDDAAGRRAALVNEAEEAARHTDDPSASAYALAGRYAALWTPDSLDERVRLGPRLRIIADATEDLSLRFMVRVFEITTLLEQGRMAQYLASVDEFEQLAARHGDVHAEWYAYLFRANIALMQGQLAHSMKLARQFHELGTRVEDANAAHSLVAYWATTEFARGNLEGLAEGAEEQVAHYPRMIGWRCAEIMFRAVRGETERVRELLSIGLEGYLECLRDDLNFILGAGFLAFAAGVVRDSRAASMLWDILSPYRDRFIVGGYGAVCWGSAARPLSVLAETLERDEKRELRESAERQERYAGVAFWWSEAIADLARSGVSGGGAHDFRSALARQRARLNGRG